MENKTLAKIVVATGAGVVAVMTAAPMLIAVPVCVGLGAYIGKQFINGDDEEEKKEDK